MSGSIDMRVVFIGAVALLIALQEGPSSHAPALSFARPDLVRCVPVDSDAALRFAEAIGDITGSITPATHRSRQDAICR